MVTIEDRPDLRVRLRNNVYQAPALVVAKVSKDADTERLRVPPRARPRRWRRARRNWSSTLGSLYPRKHLPVSLAVGYRKRQRRPAWC